MEGKLNFWERTKRAIAVKTGYSLPPELFNGSRGGSSFKLLNRYMSYPYGTKSDSQRYMKSFKESPLVFMIVNKIATTTSAIPQVAVNPEDRDKQIEDSVLLAFLNAPNLTQTEKEFRQSIYQALSLDGNVYLYKSETIGFEKDFTVQIWSPAYTEIKTNDDGAIIGYEYRDQFNNEINVGIEDLDKVLHIHTSNIAQCESSRAYQGVSTLEALWIVVKSSDEKFNAEASIFKNRGIIGILTNRSDIPMLKKDRERLQGEFDEEVGGSDRFNKIKISNTKLEYIQTGMSPTDLKLLEGIVSSLRLLAAAFGLPSVLFNDNDNSTYNNVREAKITAYNDSYLPLMEMVNDKLSPWLSKHLGVKEYLKADLTRIDVLRDTTNKIMTSLNSLDPTVARNLVGALRVNDVLTMLGAEPLATGGEELLGPGKKDSTTE